MQGGTVTGNNAINSNGGGVSNEGSNAMFILENGKITRNRSAWGGGVFNNRGTFNMNSGNISYNEALRYGGGVQNQAIRSQDEIENEEDIFGYFNFNGGTISNNTANSNGGGVHNSDRGIIIMLGGTLSNNNANDGGGIRNWGIFHMRGGSITSNTGINGVGGVHSAGVYSEFNHVRGDIFDNRPRDLN